jgi:hypothetical protein
MNNTLINQQKIFDHYINYASNHIFDSYLEDEENEGAIHELCKLLQIDDSDNYLYLQIDNKNLAINDQLISNSNCKKPVFYNDIESIFFSPLFSGSHYQFVLDRLFELNLEFDPKLINYNKKKQSIFDILAYFDKKEL